MVGSFRAAFDEREAQRVLRRLFDPSRAQANACIAAQADMLEGDVAAWRDASSEREIIEALGLDDAERTGAAAWERLASRGIIPLEWPADPLRGFVHGDEHTRRWSDETRELEREARSSLLLSVGPRYSEGPDDHGRGTHNRTVEYRTVHDAPVRVSDALVLGSDARGVATAEALVRECASRLAPWSRAEWSRGEIPPRVLWRVVGAHERFSLTESGHGAETPPALRRVLDGALDGKPLYDVVDELQSNAPPIEHGWPRSWLAECQQWVLQRSAGALAWRALLASDARVPKDAETVPDAWRGTPFRALPDPYEPMIELWQTGYVAQGFYEEGLVLVAAPASDDR